MMHRRGEIGRGRLPRLELDTRERDRRLKEHFAAVEALSPAARAVYDTAHQWATSVSPELAMAMAEAVLKAAAPKPPEAG